MKFGVAVQFDADVTMQIGKEGLTIQIEDRNAGTRICEVKLGPEEACAALGSHASCKAQKATAYGLHLIGKYQIMDDFVFEMPEHDWRNSQEVAAEKAKRICPDGWMPDLYFNSQNSFFVDDDGKTMARTYMRMWVSKDEKDTWDAKKAKS